MKSLPNDLDYGKFNQVTISQLKEFASKIKLVNDVVPLIVHTRSKYYNDELFDTSSLQINNGDGAMYQVASNFNCLELGNWRVDPFSGYYLTKLMHDSTQGPSAAGGCSYGAILRLAEHKKKPINLLEKTSLKPINGKLYESKHDEQLDDVMIGVHSDVRATFDRSKMGKCVYYKNGPSIDQVFTSTIILDGNPDEQQTKIAKHLLQVAYEGTYLAAACRRSPKLVLTLIGGGAFQNPHELIVEAIKNAHQKYSKYLLPKCKVMLPIYEPKSKIAKLLKDAINEVDVVQLI